MRRRYLIGIPVLALLALAIAYVLYENPCSDLFPCHDPPSVVALEEREVLDGSRNLFAKAAAAGPVSFTDRLPRPLSVRISDYTATLTTAGPLYEGSFMYAQVWYVVYHKHHRGTRTVSMRVVWKSGSVSQTFPISDI